ncbi:MAG: hypothetical protein A3F90_12700 [Deltaproteobacteria bacterium RIFCSPLOWO2_12_FULL_60_19]|nr:MAG: hypothetical protein A3F90_12700 [Deltaproteobacteria bacterium RIFCSPLOWO2_12_FULL_60_19]
MKRSIVSLVLLGFVLSGDCGAAEGAGQKAKIQGANVVQLRAGPDARQPSRAALRAGTEVLVEGEESNWYVVSTADGKRGYVNKRFVRVLGESPKRPADKQASLPTDENRIGETQAQKPAGQAEPDRAAEAGAANGSDIYWWIGAAICLFALGWIAGGNYYLYRDRVKRTKLRF